jgi:hypothetical protein
MQRRKFEEILDECISAYLSGRRTVEESLSLYPSVARELEPLLRAAADTAEALQQFSPPPSAQERIRLNILRAANERAAARALTREIDLTPQSRMRWSWVLVAPAAAVLAGVVVVSGLFLAGSLDRSAGGQDSEVLVSEAPAFSDQLSNARRQLAELRVKARTGQAITTADIDAIAGTTRELAENTERADIAVTEQEELADILEEQLVLLGQLETGNGRGDSIEDAVAATFTTAAVLGIPIDEPSPTPAASASPSPAPTSTAEATPAPSSSPTPSPSPTPAPGP